MSRPMSFKTDEVLVKSWRDGPIGRISLNRPEKHNAKNMQMIQQLHDAMMQADEDEEVRVIVLSGEGPSFSAGHDLNEVDHFPEVAEAFSLPKARLDLERQMYFDKCMAIRNTRKPTIGQVHGHCLAAGMMSVAMCDIIIASDDAKFGMPVLSRFCAVGEILFEPWDMGARRAKEFLFTGSIVDAHRAEQLGFVNRVVPRAELDEAVKKMALQIASQPPMSLELTKASINRTMDIMGQREAWEYHFMLHVFSHFTEEAVAERARRKEKGRNWSSARREARAAKVG